MEGDPFTLIEGMAIAAYAVGATRGLRLHALGVPRRRRRLRAPPSDRAYAGGLLGASTCSARGRAFDLALRVGAGAYICGEETSMLESLEGKRGEIRAKPPLPALEGLFGKPTVVNNVLTLATVPMILARRRRGVRRPRASAARAARRSSSWPATSPGAGSSRRRSASRLRELVERVRRRHRSRPAGARGAGRRPARGLPAGGPARPADGLRGVRRGRRDGRARRRRGLRRHRRHGGAGAVRHGVLRRGVLRQVHALPGRLGARRRGHRPDRRRATTARPTSSCSKTSAR